MPPIDKPTKEQVRAFGEHRRAEHSPPPDPDEIRRRLGWKLIEAERLERLRHESDSEGGEI